MVHVTRKVRKKIMVFFSLRVIFLECFSIEFQQLPRVAEVLIGPVAEEDLTNIARPSQGVNSMTAEVALIEGGKGKGSIYYIVMNYNEL